MVMNFAASQTTCFGQSSLEACVRVYFTSVVSGTGESWVEFSFACGIDLLGG